MGKLLFGLGILTGIALTAAVVVLIIDMLIPWEEICAIVGAARAVVETGDIFVTQLQDWLAKAESFLSTATPEQTSEARTGLSGLLDKASDIASDVTRTFTDIVTAPLQGLIDLAKVVLNDMQANIDSAQNVLASVDVSRCN